jgi:hypothetical protein
MGLSCFRVILILVCLSSLALARPHLPGHNPFQHKSNENSKISFAVHDRGKSKPVKRQDSRSLPDWMAKREALIKELPITKVFLPGSHDSATYKLSSSIGKNQDITDQINKLKYAFGAGFIVAKIIKNWAMAQGESISQQLSQGIRYLDLRVIYKDDKKDFYTVHGLYGPKLDDVLAQIKSFLLQNPKEIIVIQIGDLRYMPNGEKDHEAIGLKLKNVFGDLMVPRNDGVLTPIKTLWENNTRVFVIYDADSAVSKFPFLFPRSIISSYWANVDTPKSLKEKLDANLSSRPPNFNRFYVIQSQLTANDGTIKNGLKPIPGRPRSLKDLSKRVDKEIMKWIDDWYAKGPTIIMTDFVNGLKSEKIISLNDRYFAQNRGK